MGNRKLQKNYGSTQLFYEKYYKDVIHGRGLGGYFIRKTHLKMEDSYTNENYPLVLEVGGGSGEHLDFVSHEYERYFLTDIKLPVLDALRSLDSRIVCQIANVEALPYPDNSFNRVVVTCLFHHVEKPAKAIEEILRVLKPEGIATIFLSCDPGILVRLLRYFMTQKTASRKGFQGYELMIAREHRNHVSSLLSIITYSTRFRKVKVNYFPFRLPLWDINAFIVIHIS